MTVIEGPPGSGKTHAILETFRETPDDAGRCLLAPTSTMAEHLRNRLAREGRLVRPGSILTLSKFIEPWLADLAPVSPAMFQLLVERALARVRPPAFSRVEDLAGFPASLAGLIQELSAAGGDAARVEAFAAGTGDEAARGVAQVWRAVEKALGRRRIGLRAERLRLAAGRIRARGPGGPRRVLVDGFLSLTEPELGLLAAIAEHADLVVTQPVWSGSEHTRQRLRSMGFAVRTCSRRRPEARRILVTAPTPEEEADEIARRLLERRAGGQAWREMGIVVRSEIPYVPLLRTTLERFGIPARFFFAERLEAQPAVRLVMEALGGFGELPASPSEWAGRLAGFRGTIPSGPVSDKVSHGRAILWRLEAASRDALQQALDDAAAIWEPRAAPALDEFRKAVLTAVRMTPVRVADHRRDVVNVLDVYEARQWELPVVFVCGLIERQFPRYHGPHAILADAARRALQSQGIPLATSEERQREEQFLFEFAVSRACELVVLSHPERSSGGEECLPSSFLEDLALDPAPAGAVRPRTSRRPASRRPPEVVDDALRAWIRRRHGRMSASGVESFLQCPFQFFARSTLKLVEPPAPPEERLDPRLEGTIIHEVLAAAAETPLLVESLFERIFESACGREGVPPGWRKEAVRREMLRRLLAFLALEEEPLATAGEVLVEQKFELPLEGGLVIAGKIDRTDLDRAGNATVIDYKYSAGSRLGQIVKGHNQGTRVQAGLYALAVQKLMRRRVAAMLFGAVRGEPGWRGWRDRDQIEDLIRTAVERSREAAAAVAGGRIEPQPADPSQCDYCDFRDICRVEAQSAVARTGGAAR